MAAREAPTDSTGRAVQFAPAYRSQPQNPREVPSYISSHISKGMLVGKITQYIFTWGGSSGESKILFGAFTKLVDPNRKQLHWARRIVASLYDLVGTCKGIRDAPIPSYLSLTEREVFAGCSADWHIVTRLTGFGGQAHALRLSMDLDFDECDLDVEIIWFGWELSGDYTVV